MTIPANPAARRNAASSRRGDGFTPLPTSELASSHSSAHPSTLPSSEIVEFGDADKTLEQRKEINADDILDAVPVTHRRPVAPRTAVKVRPVVKKKAINPAATQE